VRLNRASSRRSRSPDGSGTTFPTGGGPTRCAVSRRRTPPGSKSRCAPGCERLSKEPLRQNPRRLRWRG
jgi:hypothetical protein